MAITTCFAQEAKILIVDKSDSTRLADAYREYKSAQKKWEALKKEVAAKYVPVEPKVDAKGKQIGNETVIEAGWENPQFSGDFRAIVPANSQYASRGCSYSGVVWPGYNGWATNYPVSTAAGTAGNLNTLTSSTGTFAPNQNIESSSGDFVVGNNTMDGNSSIVLGGVDAKTSTQTNPMFVNDGIAPNVTTVERRPR
jgi:hypothetical protein